MRRFVVLSCFALLCAASPALRAHPVFEERSIVNAASYMPAGLKGGAIARGSHFTIFGLSIGPGTPVVAQQLPLRPELAGVSLRIAPVQAGQPAVSALPWFVSESQINAIMPSNAPLGAVTIQLTFNDGDGSPSSIPVRAEVAEASFGIFTAARNGRGPASATIFETQENQPHAATTRSARPGQVVVLWGTGLGAVSGGDDRPPAEVGATEDLKVRSQVEVWVGGARAEILYAGRSPQFAGTDQINFVVPQGAALGCYSPVWVKVVGGRVSNVATLAIRNEPGPCTDPVNPYFGPDSGPRLGLVLPQRVRYEVTGAATLIDTASASFQEMTLQEFFFNPALSLPPRGTCLLFHPTSLEPEGLPHERPAEALDASPASTPMLLNGPRGQRQVTRSATGFYEALLEDDYLLPGVYTLNSPGGPDVAAFRDEFTVGEPPTFRLPGDGVTVRRDQSIAVSWTGGDPQKEVVRILGVVSSSALTTVRVRAMFVCAATPEQGGLDIPGDILSNLPVSVGSGASSTAQIYVGVSPLPETSQFEAEGLDFGAVVPIVMRGKPITVR